LLDFYGIGTEDLLSVRRLDYPAPDVRFTAGIAIEEVQYAASALATLPRLGVVPADISIIIRTNRMTAFRVNADPAASDRS
jgi:hypothetical protein